MTNIDAVLWIMGFVCFGFVCALAEVVWLRRMAWRAFANLQRHGIIADMAPPLLAMYLTAAATEFRRVDTSAPVKMFDAHVMAALKQRASDAVAREVNAVSVIGRPAAPAGSLYDRIQSRRTDR